MSKVVFHSWASSGAPTLNNVQNSLNDVLNAVLVEGYNVKTVSSISVSGGTATVTATGHLFTVAHAMLVEIRGAADEGLNLKTNIQYVDANTFTYLVTDVPDGTYATGTMTARWAPLGWTRPYFNTICGVYQKGGVSALAPMLRVVDASSTSTTQAKAMIVESATGPLTADYTNRTPTSAQLPGDGVWWSKGGANTSTAKVWFIIGDEQFFYFFAQGASGLPMSVVYFGDPIAYYSPDPFFTIISGSTDTDSSSVYNSAFALLPYNAAVGTSTIRKISRNIGTDAYSVDLGLLGYGITTLGNGGQTTSTNRAVNGPVYIQTAGAEKVIRGHMPGLLAPLATTIDGVFTDPYNPTKVYRAFQYTSSASNYGYAVFDISDTWRIT